MLKTVDHKYPFVKIGVGTIIEENVVIGENTVIGYCNTFKDTVTLGKHVYISHHCIIAKGTVIEDDVFIGPGVITMNTKRICHGRNREYTGQCTPILIKRGARIGGGAVLLPGIVIGRESMIGAGAVVTRDTEPFMVYVGNPARKIGSVPEEERL